MKQTIEQIKRKIQKNVKSVIPTEYAIRKIPGSNIWHIYVIKTAINESKQDLWNIGFDIVYDFDNGLIIASYDRVDNTHYGKQVKDLRGRLIK